MTVFSCEHLWMLGRSTSLVLLAIFPLPLVGCSFDVPALSLTGDPVDLRTDPSVDLTGSVADLSMAPDLRPVMGHLAGAVADSTNMSVDLTTGARDWVHWGLNATPDITRKAGITPLISNFTGIGGGTLKRFTDNRVSFTWSDGAPTQSSSGTTNGVYYSNMPKGFQITAPADGSTRTLKVYVSSYQADIALTAHLSDASAFDYTNTQVNAVTNANIYREYTFVYRSATPGTLQVRWIDSVDHNGGGNVTLSAAILQ